MKAGEKGNLYMDNILCSILKIAVKEDRYLPNVQKHLIWF